MGHTIQLETTKQMRPHSPGDANCNAEELWVAVRKFTAWLDKSGYASYDPYDIWGSSYGRWARRLYYQKHPAGVFLIAPVLLMEILCPGLRGLFVKKDRYPTADAQLALGFLNLHQVSRNKESTGSDPRSPSCHDENYLTKAKGLSADLLAQSVPGYSGYGWGYPFDWQNVNGLMPKGTPHITATPYCYEVFTSLYDATGESCYLDVARSIAAFVDKDFNDTPTGSDSAAASYTPTDDGKVVNASAYRAFVLFDAAWRFENIQYRAKAWKNLRFILQNQMSDGSWWYAVDSPGETFIDNFHTCFVLKNLHKLNRRLHSVDVRQAVERGYNWYREALFDKQDNPKSFARAPRLQIARLEMYNVAEAITLGVLLKNEIPRAYALSMKLAARLVRRYQLSRGHWVTRVYLGGVKHTLPFLRWPQAQLFLALTNLLVEVEKGESAETPEE